MENGEQLLISTGFFGGDKNVLKLIVVTVIYPCDYTKITELQTF